MSKVLESLLKSRLESIIEDLQIFPNHQFGFRRQHGTTEQIHRVISKIREDMEAKRYCSAVFLDVSQAFDKVWHTGLLYKLRLHLPTNYFCIIKSYLLGRHFKVKVQNELTPLFPINAGVPQGSVLAPLLYLIYTADLPSTPNATTATFADDTAIMVSNDNPGTASLLLQVNLDLIQNWLKKWRIKINEAKSTHVTFTNRKGNCPPVKLNNVQIPQSDDAKYLGMHIDRRLTWRKHIFTKRKQLGLKLHQLYWLTGRKSNLSTKNKLLIYKALLKPVWTYGIELWGSTANSNIEILERFQSKVLRTIVKAPWYVPNAIIARDLKVLPIKKEIKLRFEIYKKRLSNHPNTYAKELITQQAGRRLKRYHPHDSLLRF